MRLRAASGSKRRASFGAALLLVTMLLARAVAGDTATKANAEENNFTIRGKCVDSVDRTPLPKIAVRLFVAEGRTSPPREIARGVTDAQGQFKFENLAPERPYEPLARRVYAVVAEDPQRPTGIGLNFLAVAQKQPLEIWLGRQSAVLSGTVKDDDGKPVVGAQVIYWSLDDRAIPGVLSAVTDAGGRFAIERMTATTPVEVARFNGIKFQVVHPDYPETQGKAMAVPTDVVVTMHKGCRASGIITDGITGKPAADAVVKFENLGEYHETIFGTDAAGKFRGAVPPGRYNIKVEAADRVCVAITDREFSDESTELPPMKLTAGGFISGRVINKKTGEPATISDNGDAITIGFIGPSQPLGHVISPTGWATVERDGRYTLRAAPGENFPYFVNIRGDRMAWNTREKPAVIVKDGETTTYDMTITPETPPAEKLKAAEKLVAALPKDPHDRTEAILVEFRKLSHTVDECELWCTLMRELVAIGPDAVPQLCEELDKTTADRSLRRLAFALRAIGDKRAVPALIRALPKTMLPSASDYGLIVNDAALMDFMRKHDLDGGKNGNYFDFGRAVREVVGALHKLTKQDFNDSPLFGISRSEDPRRQTLQRRFFLKQAEQWQTWWEANWRQLTDDAAYQKVSLAVADEPLPPAAKSLGPHSQLGDGDGFEGMTVSPAADKGKHATHFLDLGTGRELQWPAQFNRDEAKLDPKQLAAWARENSVDLMCITHTSPEGAQTYVLKAFDMHVWEIGPRDLQNLDKLVAAGKLPEGHRVDELLMHFDGDSKEYVPNANAAFIYINRDGCMGLIEITDRVTRTQDLTGGFGAPPAGVGFFKGVRFNTKTIIP